MRCQKPIEDNHRGTAVFVRVEEGFYGEALRRTRRSVEREKTAGKGAAIGPEPSAFRLKLSRGVIAMAGT